MRAGWGHPRTSSPGFAQEQFRRCQPFQRGATARPQRLGRQKAQTALLKLNLGAAGPPGEQQRSEQAQVRFVADEQERLRPWELLAEEGRPA